MGFRKIIPKFSVAICENCNNGVMIEETFELMRESEKYGYETMLDYIDAVVRCCNKPSYHWIMNWYEHIPEIRRR